MKKKVLSILLTIFILAVSAPLLPAMADTQSELSLETVIEPQYDMVKPFSGGLAAVQKDGLWGYIDESGKMVIQPKYQTAGFFNEKSAVVALENGTLQKGEQSIYILRDDASAIPLTAPGRNAGGYWEQQAPLHYNPETSSLPDLKNQARDGVVAAGGSAYLPDGKRIEPEFMGMNGEKKYAATDFGFYQNYDDYTVLGPCVNGVIPCKAVFSSKESYGQCFYMDKTGKILNVFHTYDEKGKTAGDRWGITCCYAPDPETGLIAMRFAQKPADFWTFVDSADNYQSFRTVDDSRRFHSIMISKTGLIWSENAAVVKKMNDSVQLLLYRNGAYSSLNDTEYSDATMFSEGFCAVREGDRWHFVNKSGKAFQAAGPDGSTAKITALGLFENGVATAYDESSGKYYLVSRSLKNGVFQAVSNSDILAAKVYFSGFEPGRETAAFMGFTNPGSLIAIEKNGKYGFAKITGSISPNNPFVDVHEGDYYYEPVLWAVENQITAGTSETTFSPEDSCTRAQVVTFLWRASGEPEPKTASNPFKDVNNNKYYYKAVLWAVENEITAGTSETAFSPEEDCKREHVVTFLWRANKEPKPKSSSNPFKDVKSSDYFYKAVLWAVENEITAGTSATAFSPGDLCKREHVVTFLYRAMN